MANAAAQCLALIDCYGQHHKPASIIDILQPYDYRKRIETIYKTKKKGSKDYTHCAVSSIPAKDYGIRFLNFVHARSE